MKNFFKTIIGQILTAEARVVLKRKRPKIIAITGSVGKTSTKDAIYAAIKNNIYARKSEKSFNSVDIGVQLTILGLPNAWSNPFLWLRNIVDGFFTAFFSKNYPEILILETGIDRPGEMAKLTKWLKPDMVVLTRLPAVPVHVEFFSSPEAVIEEKMQLVTALKPEGVLIYNHDDTVVQSKLPEILQRQVGFGRYLETDFTAREDRVVYEDDRPKGVEFIIKHYDHDYKVTLYGTVGTQHTYSCCAALAVADELSVPIESATQSLSQLTTPKGRLRLLPGIKGTLILDDSYNSSPIACEHALQTIKELTYATRKIAVLGDMMELGKFSSEQHRNMGMEAAGAVDILVTIGVRARLMAEGALAAGMSEKHIFQYDDAVRAGQELQNIMQTGDVILIKASQSIRAERIVEEVMAEPEKADDLLVRQDLSWKAKI